MEWFLRMWLPIALAVTGMCILAFGIVHQTYRFGLNDPQIQMAEDAAFALEGGEKLSLVVASTTRKVDVAASLSPYIVVYDKDMVPLAWTGELDGKPPMPPESVFADAKNASGDRAGENRVSWQPRDDVRSALVVVHVLKSDGYVIAGRNMREVEGRIWDMQLFVCITWLLTLASTLIATWLGARAAAGTTGVIW